MSKSNGKSKKLLFVIIAVVLVIAIAVGVVIATTGNASTPGTKNNDEVEKVPESIILYQDGDPVKKEDVTAITGATSPDGTVIIPVSKVSFGLAAGGGEYVSKHNKSPEESKPFAGGVGAGVTISPVAFLAVNEKNVRLLPVDGDEPVSKLIDYIPVMVDKVSGIISERANKKENTSEE